MRKGRSVVLEEDHTLILGWSDTIFTVLSELEIANESQQRPSVVILADRDKVEMDDLIREKVRPQADPDRDCRSGSPIDLGRPRPRASRSWRARSSSSRPRTTRSPTPQVIKTILALTKGHDRRDRAYHIVAEIQDPREPRGGRTGRRRRGGPDRQARDDRQAGRPLGAPVGRLGRLHRAARLRRRRDLLPRGPGAGRPAPSARRCSPTRTARRSALHRRPAARSCSTRPRSGRSPPASG